MATRPAPPPRDAASKRRPSTSASFPIRRNGASPRKRSTLLPGFGSPRSVDLAGRTAALSVDVPVIFDAPLAPHHRLIGQWVAFAHPTKRSFTRRQARSHIERTFNAAVLDVLAPLNLAEFRVVVLNAQDDRPPAAAVVCDSIGQLDLGWIETSDTPTAWRAAAYRALERMLGTVLPIFAFQDLFDEMSMCYWEGETSDEAARQFQIDYQGIEPDEIDEEILPSAINGRRPDWMIAENRGPPRDLPDGLRRALRALNEAHRAVRRQCPEHNAWHFDGYQVHEYLPGIEEASSLPPLTLVPVEQFAREVDDIARHGMEYGFLDIAGLCPLHDSAIIDGWFASLRVGARFLLAAQDLIQLDPSTL